MEQLIISIFEYQKWPKKSLNAFHFEGRTAMGQTIIKLLNSL